MLSNEQLLKSYILNELYFLEKDNLLNEGAIWDWVKKQPRNIKEFFTNKESIKAIEKEIKKPSNSKKYQEVLNKLRNQEHSSAFKRTIGAIGVTGLLFLTINMHYSGNVEKALNDPGIQDTIEQTLEETKPPSSFEKKTNYSHLVDLSGYGNENEETEATSDNQQNLQTDEESKEDPDLFVGKFRIHFGKVIKKVLTSDEKEVYEDTLKQTGSEAKAEIELSRYLIEKSTESLLGDNENIDISPEAFEDFVHTSDNPVKNSKLVRKQIDNKIKETEKEIKELELDNESTEDIEDLKAKAKKLKNLKKDILDWEVFYEMSSDDNLSTEEMITALEAEGKKPSEFLISLLSKI